LMFKNLPLKKNIKEDLKKFINEKFDPDWM
jgi:hypothetical protein